MKSLIVGSLSMVLMSAGFAIAPEDSVGNMSSAVEAIAETSESNLIARGSFVTTEANHPTSGMATIIKENGKRYLVFDQNFKTVNGPDVQVVLHRSSPVPVKLQERDYIAIAPLQSINGKQRYALANNLQLDEFEAVSIWCRRFNISFGYAALQ